MSDRRRINGPPGGTNPPFFYHSYNSISNDSDAILKVPSRTRPDSTPRQIFLQTGLVPSASGSAYFEISPSTPPTSSSLIVPHHSSPKLTVTIHGPRPLPRNSPFTSTLVLSAHVKFAPFASRGKRRGYVRDSLEKDLGAHLETALRGVVLLERYPKSCCDVIVTVLEGEDDQLTLNNGITCLGAMTVLAGCITASSAALVDAGIDCLDLITGGVASFNEDTKKTEGSEETALVVDPCPVEHENIKAACVVGYLQTRDEITELWLKGDAGSQTNHLIDKAVEAAQLQRIVLSSTLKASMGEKLQSTTQNNTEMEVTI